VDCVICDPPYDKRTHAGALTISADKAAKTGEYGIPFKHLESPSELAKVLLKCAKRWVVAFCTLEQIADYQIGAGDAWIRAGVWDKIAPGPQITGDRPGQAVDGIAIMHNPGKKKWNRGGGSGIWRVMPPKGDERPDHPTPKPEKLMGMLVNDFTDANETVLDPYMGSGTTGIACLRTGRNFIGIEIDPKHYATACERMAREIDGELI
jgi:site-specific DNA-methyltransferase (adenine-specific)